MEKMLQKKKSEKGSGESKHDILTCTLNIRRRTSSQKGSCGSTSNQVKAQIAIVDRGVQNPYASYQHVAETTREWS
jgi:hypothetical protein